MPLLDPDAPGEQLLAQGYATGKNGRPLFRFRRPSRFCCRGQGGLDRPSGPLGAFPRRAGRSRPRKPRIARNGDSSLSTALCATTKARCQQGDRNRPEAEAFSAATTMWPVSHLRRTASKSGGIGPGFQVARIAFAGATSVNHAASPPAKKAAPARANQKPAAHWRAGRKESTPKVSSSRRAARRPLQKARIGR